MSELTSCLPRYAPQRHAFDSWLGFTDARRLFYILVELGRSAPTQTRSDAIKILDSLVITRRRSSGIPTVAPSTVLTDQPWIGSACPGPDSPAAIKASAQVPLCDRIGLAINLRTPAVGATATINGQSFKLDSAAWRDPSVGGKHRSLAGFCRPPRF